MEYFNTHKNKLFILITRIMNQSIEGKKFTIEQVEDMIRETMIADEDFVENVLDNKENSYEIMTYDFKPILNEGKIRINPTILEQRWLKSIVSEDLVKLFLHKDIVDKLSSKLSHVEPLFNLDFPKDNIKYEDMKTIIHTFKNNNLLKYDCVNKYNRQFKNQIAIPFKINYSTEDNKFRLSVYSIIDGRLINMNMENLKKVHSITLDDINDKTIYNKAKLIEYEINKDGRMNFFTRKLKEQSKTVKISMDKNENISERVHLLFSSYEKKSYVDKEKEYVTIRYYRFDEENIIRKILSLGVNVKVVEPDYIKEKIVKLLMQGEFLNREN